MNVVVDAVVGELEQATVEIQTRTAAGIEREGEGIAAARARTLPPDVRGEPGINDLRREISAIFMGRPPALTPRALSGGHPAML